MAGAGKELQVAGGGSKVQEVEVMKEDSTGSGQGATTTNMEKTVEIQSPKKRGRKRKVAPTREKIVKEPKKLMTTPKKDVMTPKEPLETPEELLPTQEKPVENMSPCQAAAIPQEVEEAALARFVELCWVEYCRRFPGPEVVMKEHIGRRCRERWAGLGGLDKRPFLRMAEDVNQNTEEPVEVGKVEEEAKPLGAGKRKKKKDSLLPKRAPSGYILFR